jgi:hypothetical protein
MGKGHWWNDSGKRKAKYSRRNLYHCHIFYLILTQTDPKLNPYLPSSETGD